MYLSMIKKYINQISKEDIGKFAKTNNIFLSSHEISVIEDIIHDESNILSLLNNKEDIIFNKYKKYFSNSNYLKIKDLYYKYKNKFKY